MYRFLLASVFTLFSTITAIAQEIGWIQVEAQPTLTAAQDRARAYSTLLDNVNGYYLGGSWYGIALGPYGVSDAEALMRQLKSEGTIPRDSFIADGSRFQSQFWPIGVGAPTTAQPLPQDLTATAPVAEEPAAEEPVVVEITPEPEIRLADETPAQARASESALSRPEREELQIALKWAGFYNSSIDGAFGRGTRSSMAAWQEANNHEATGILTTAQRAELIGQYNAVLESMDMQLVQDDAAGVEIQMPTGVVAFAKYDPPFARYDAKTDLGVQVLLISQEGDQTRFNGLYEILQTLEIVPVDGPRSRNGRTFEIDGENSEIHTYISATLDGTQIKGFALVWPAGDEERRTRVLDLMKASFATTDSVLDPASAAPGDDQGVDLISGLAIRKASQYQSGFYIDEKGDVMTSAEGLDQCEYLTIDDDHRASIVYQDDELGFAVLRPDVALAPMQVAEFQTGVPRLQSDVAAGGYPYGGVLTRPSLTFGKLADIRGLNGEGELKRLDLVAQPGDVGGPVFDNGGAVLGMLLPRVARNGQVLPAEVNFALDAGQIVASLQNGGITAQTTDTMAFMPPETMTLVAGDVTVLVSCW